MYNGRIILSFLGFRYDDPKKQIEIAFVLQITDVSVRSSYKRWFREFPELFQSAITKLPEQEFRCRRYPISRSQ